MNVLFITFATWISISSARFPTQEPVVGNSNPDLGPCNEENVGQREMITDNDGNETLIICSQDNGVYKWKNIESEDDETDVMEDFMLKREAATEFLQRSRRGLNHECYVECCDWEEVREHYEHDMRAAEIYWEKYNKWRRSGHHC